MIIKWLELFRTGWVTKDVEKVMELFTDDVEYWETPHKKLLGKSDIENEWKAIFEQQNIELNFEVFSSSNDKHALLWQLTYVDDDLETQYWAGTYLIALNEAGKCNYFHQTGEKR